MKKTWKRFFSLDRRHAEGFTLVELIVVIAILAILGGVAVPAYSGYVEKANKQADISLISEIEHALTLAGYSGKFNDEPSGCIKLSTAGLVNADEVDGTALEEALIATFGTGYADTLKLSYDGWGNSGLLNELDYYSSYYVSNSSYMTGNRSDRLLTDVETITKMAGEVVSVLNGTSSVDASLTNMFNSKSDVLGETAAKYGLSIDNKYKDATTGKVNWDAWGADNDTAYGNLLVLAAAEEANKHYSSLGTENVYEMSEASTLILGFAGYYGYAARNEAFSNTLNTKLEELANVKNMSDGKAWFEDLESAASEAGYSSYYNPNDADGEYLQYETDKGAFLSILSALGDPTSEQAALIASDLNNENLFSDGVVNDMYNDYLTAVDTAYQMGSSWNVSIAEGEVVILFSQKNGMTMIMNTMPTA